MGSAAGGSVGGVLVGQLGNEMCVWVVSNVD